MLVDEVKIKVVAGKGGDGTVAFNKNAMALGPTGGSGGRGGDIYLEGVSDIGALRKFRFQKEFRAENGRDGRSQFRDGADGKDLIIYVPVGSVVYNMETGQTLEITNIKQQMLVAKGGRGGKGNFLFRSSKRTSPKIYEHGREGDSFELHLELKLIADVGFIGLPNVGKSSLLNELTGAKSKVANYAFTTLEPSLGVYGDLILADIPGLIEGASEGKGLGAKFLRHIERTRVLFHFVCTESSSPLKDYDTIREELGRKNKKLLEKKEYIILSKKDMVPEDNLRELVKKLKKKNCRVLPVSAIDDESLVEIRKVLNKLEEEKTSRQED